MKKILRTYFGLLLLLLLLVVPGCKRVEQGPAKRGGQLVASQASGPRTFNPLFASDNDSLTVLDCLMAVLVRINRQTGETQLELAESLESSPDHKVLTIHLRKGVQFSDGHPLTADDVLFTFKVIYDPALRGPVTDLLTMDGKKIEVEKLDDYTLRLTFPKPYGPAERLLDAVYILPQHTLEPAYTEGCFQSVWSLSTPADQIVGLGPFALKEYVPGQKTVLARNPHYWKQDETGQPLPYLDEITLLILPDRSTRLLKFQQGEIDLLSPLTPEEAASLQAQVTSGQIKTFDLGPSLITELLWFNLNPKASSVSPMKLGWFKDARFRQAVSFAVDREAIVDVVFSGKAAPLWGPVPERSKWYNPNLKKYPYDPQQAKTLLGQAGFADRDGDGIVEDARGNDLAFTLVTNAGNVLRERMGLMIQEDLKKVGIKVNFVPLESKALLDKINQTFDYEACLFAIQLGDVDPSALMNILPSSGANHWWYPQEQTPATDWEKRIDQLMSEQLGAPDISQRKAYFDEVQSILSEQVPFIYLVSRDLIVGAKTSVKNLKPGLLRDFLLWNAEELYLSGGAT